MKEHPSKNHAQELLQELQEHPFLQAHLEALLAIVKQKEGQCETADEAELALIEEMRKLGKDALTEWARHGHTRAVEEARAEHIEIKTHSKKKQSGIRPSGKSKS